MPDTQKAHHGRRRKSMKYVYLNQYIAVRIIIYFAKSKQCIHYKEMTIRKAGNHHAGHIWHKQNNIA